MSTSEVMLALVAIGSALAVVYLFIEFVWWSPTTNDRRHTGALGLRELYKKLHASGSKQLHSGTPRSDAVKPVRQTGTAISAAAPKDELEDPSFDVPPDLTARVNRRGAPGECRPNSS